MPFQLLKEVLDAVRRFYPSASLSEVAVRCTYDLMASAGYKPTVTELAEASGASLSSVSRWLAHYQDQGLVENRQDPHDERALRVYQTDVGRAFMEQLKGVLLEVLPQERRPERSSA